ncbi:MAG: hypothetical protein CMM59_16460 [Rhodospirillaceae bacterium]|nr:hypothetical protein [Rhodospirillaceae bacterium]
MHNQDDLEKAQKSARHLLRHCGSLQQNERLAIVHDSSTRDLAELIGVEARKFSPNIELCEIPVFDMHGEEPPLNAADLMSAADLVLGLTSKSMAHSRARLRSAENGARYLSLPDYSIDILTSAALNIDFRQQRDVVESVTEAFSKGEKVEVSTRAGTQISLNIAGRVGNCCPGFVDEKGALGSPPDIESNISPVEDASRGKIVVDGSIPHPELGLLKEQVELDVSGGSIVSMRGPRDYIEKLDKLFLSAGSPKAKILAECGVGLNPSADLTGNMLTDEGAAGTMHFGFGSNATVGGTNDIGFHLDFVFRDATLVVDGVTLIQDGEVIHH